MTKNGRISVKYNKTEIAVRIPEQTKALLLMNGQELVLEAGKETVVKR